MHLEPRFRNVLSPKDQTDSAVFTGDWGVHTADQDWPVLEERDTHPAV